MKIVCAYCDRVMQQGSGREVSHGICPECNKILATTMFGEDPFTDAEKIRLFDDFWFSGQLIRLGIKWRDLDKEELRMGIEDELAEHTDNFLIAMRIALDHLAKDPHYYSRQKEAGL